MERKKTGRPPRPGPVRLVRAELWTEQAEALSAYAKQRGITVVDLLRQYAEELTGVPAWPTNQEELNLKSA